MDTQSTKKIKNPPPITLDHLSTSHQIPNNLGMLENHLQNTLESPSEWVLNWILIHCCSRHQCIRVSPEFYSSRFIFLGSHWLLINAGEKLGWSKKKKKKTTKTGLCSQKRDAWVIRKKKNGEVCISEHGSSLDFTQIACWVQWESVLPHMKAEWSEIYGLLHYSPRLLFRVGLSDKATLSQVWQVDWLGKIAQVFMPSVELLKQTDMWPLSKMALKDTIHHIEAETKTLLH